MPPLTLPPRSPATLRAFWLSMSGLAGASAGAAWAVRRRDPRLLASALPIAALVAAPGLRSPDAVVLPYRAWNRLGQITGRFATRWITRVAFETLVAGGDRDDLPEMPMRSTGSSAWRARVSQPAAAYVNQDASPLAGGGRDAIDRFVAEDEHAWARPVRPLVRLLDAVYTEDDADELPPPDIYTLY